MRESYHSFGVFLRCWPSTMIRRGAASSSRLDANVWLLPVVTFLFPARRQWRVRKSYHAKSPSARYNATRRAVTRSHAAISRGRKTPRFMRARTHALGSANYQSFVVRMTELDEPYVTTAE